MVDPNALYSRDEVARLAFLRRTEDSTNFIGTAPGGLSNFGAIFAPTDMVAVAYSPLTAQPIELGTLLFLSLSVHRDKFPVVSMGRRGVRGFTRGHRTVAGSMVFHFMDEDALTRIADELASAYPKAHSKRRVLSDELPPFDVFLSFVNENGFSTEFQIMGIEILDSGITVGMDDPNISETLSYAAVDVTSHRSYATVNSPMMHEAGEVYWNGTEFDLGAGKVTHGVVSDGDSIYSIANELPPPVHSGPMKLIDFFGTPVGPYIPGHSQEIWDVMYPLRRAKYVPEDKLPPDSIGNEGDHLP